MRIIDITKVKPGMEIGKTIYSDKGDVLLRKGTVLKETYIKNLHLKNIPAIYINDEISEEIQIEEIVSLETQVRATTKIKEVFLETKPTFKNKNPILSTKNYFEVKKMIDLILAEINGNKGIMFNMVEVLSTDLYTYKHSVNVAILSLMVAKELGIFTIEQLKNIGIGALLHDLGKTQIDDAILHKPGKLTQTEFNEMKKHPVIGYTMLKDNIAISPYVKTIVLMHHEKLDGTGYPLQVKANKFHKHVRVVATVDIFDALITDRVYRKKMPIYKSLELVASLVPNKLDEEIFNILRKKIAPFPPGTAVLLNTGEKGLVTKVFASQPTRPIIKVVLDKNNNYIKELKVLDLMKELTIFIEDRTLL